MVVSTFDIDIVGPGLSELEAGVAGFGARPLTGIV